MIRSAVMRVFLGVLVSAAASVSAAEGDASQKLCVDKCGDGECQEMVCLGEGCPCAETADSCPRDCVAPEGPP